MSVIDDDDRPRVQCITPDWAVPTSIKVYSATRLGGVSKSPYKELNLGLHVNDEELHVRKNRELLLHAIKAPEEPLWLNQVHGMDVFFIDRLQTYGEPLTADGSFTREHKRVLSVVTADCLPIVIANIEGSAVAVIHAGWRGLVSGIVQSALAHFSEEDQLHAWLGPAIGPDAFEVGQDVVDPFIERDEKNAAAFVAVKADDAVDDQAPRDKKYMADLYQLARIELNRSRRIIVTGGEYCTYTDSDLFHSFRRDGVRSGRMATLAWIE